MALTGGIEPGPFLEVHKGFGNPPSVPDLQCRFDLALTPWRARLCLAEQTLVRAGEDRVAYQLSRTDYGEVDIGARRPLLPKESLD